MTKYLLVAGGRSGIGRTTAALNIAHELAKSCHTVLVDADVRSPSVALYLGTPHVRSSLNDALRQEKPITQVAYLHPSGLHCVPASARHEDTVSVDSSRIGEALLDLAGICDVVVIDSGSLHEMDTVLPLVDGVVLVSSADSAGVADSLRALKHIDAHNKPVGILLARVRGDGHELDARSVKSLLQRPLIGIIPEDDEVRKATYRKALVAQSAPQSAAAQGYAAVAQMLLRGMGR